MIFGRHRVGFRRKKCWEESGQPARPVRQLGLWGLRTGVAFFGMTGGWLGGVAGLRLPVEAVLANATDSEVLLNAAGNPHLAQGLPENTPYAMFFSTQDESLAALEQFELFAKISDLTGKLQNPLSLPFLPLGFGLEYEGAPWAGEQAAIAILPETAPRRVSPTDLNSKFYGISQIADTEAFNRFVEAIETAKAEAPEKKVYQEATLWVWPAQTKSFSDDGSDFEPPSIQSPEIDLSKRSPNGEKQSTPLDHKLDRKLDRKIALTDREPGLPLPSRSPGTFGEPPFGDIESDGSYVVPGLTIAQMGDYVVISPESQTVKDVIEYQRRASSLTENELFLRSQYIQHPDALFHIYANLSETSKFNVSDIFSSLGQVPRPPVPSRLPTLPDLPALSTIFSAESRLLASRLTQGMTMEAIAYPQKEGLRLQGRLYGNELVRPVATPELPYADSAIQYVPAPAYTLGSGRNPASFWQRVASFLSANETTQGFLERARFLVSSFTGLDLDTELIGWMDREVAFFSFPSNRGLVNEVFPGAGVEFGLAVQTSDRAQAETTLSTIGEVAQDFVSAEIAVDTLINERPAVNWRIPAEGTDSAFSFLGHSWVSEDTVMFTSGIGSMERLLNATAFEPLDEHPTFLNATRSLANPNNGYSYINAGSSLSLIYGFVEDWFELDANDPFFVTAKSYLGTVRSLSGTTSSTADYWQLDSLVNLAPAESDDRAVRLQPLPEAPVDFPIEVEIEAVPGD